MKYEIRCANGDTIIIDEEDYCDLKKALENRRYPYDSYFFLFEASIYININYIVSIAPRGFF